MIASRTGDWLTAGVGDDLVMMSVEKGMYLGLSEVGARIWELMEPPRSLDDICAVLVGEFDVPPQVCRAEVDAFLADLVKHGAAALDGDAPAV